MVTFLARLILCTCLAPGLVVAQSGGEARISVPHEHYTLGNGLHVILAPDRTLPRVEVNLWYRVGSKDEAPGRSGFAHLFEHLMFMGTERVPNAEFDEIMESGGGANNATTSSDRTNYFDWGPANLLETLLWLEADRLESLDEAMTQEKLDAQREIVRNERRENGENSPYGVADLLVSELMYPPGHPYQISTIGKHEDLQAATVKDVTDFFQRYYVPNNASLAIVGDFDPAQAKLLIERLFADLPPGPEPPVVRADPVRLDGERRTTLQDKVQFPRLGFVWHSPAVMKPGDAEMDLLADLLGGGRSSRLYQRLVVQDQSAVDVAAYQASSLLGSLFYLEIYAAPDADLGAVEAAVDEELARLRAEGPLPEELQRAVAGLESGAVARLESLHARADALNSYLLHFGTPDGFERDLDRYRQATVPGVQAWARSVLDAERRLVMTVLPESNEQPLSGRGQRPLGAAAGAGVGAGAAPPDFVPPVPQSYGYASGLQVWHLERSGLPLVSITLALPGGRLAEQAGQEGLATLTAAMMEEGAGTRDALAFSQALEQLGASFSVTAGARQTLVSLSVLKRNLPQAVELFHDAVARPRFEAVDFERARRLQVEGLRQELDDPGRVAALVGNAIYWGAEHPYGRPPAGTPESVATLELAHVRAFHAGLARPQGALLVLAGDLSEAESAKLTVLLDRGWPKGAPLSMPSALPAPDPRGPRLVLIDRPGAPQTVVRFIMPGHSSTDALRLPADAFNTLLGGSFTSRLNQNLRENKQYTYGANCRFLRQPDQGIFIAGAHVLTAVTGAALSEFAREFERLRGTEGPPDIDAAEAAGAATTVLSRIVAGYESLGSTVGTWLELRERGAAPGDAAKDVAALRSIDAGRLNALAPGLLPVDRALLVLVGDAQAVLPQLEGLELPAVQLVDERGRPVEPAR
ncbi:MAG: M16 family metallopeptidase [Planctomycetota bacterium]